MNRNKQPRKAKPANSFVVTASELGQYSYCARSWWYRAQGYESENVAQLDAGTQAHAALGRHVRRARAVRIALLICILLALLFILWAYFTNKGAV